MKRCYSCGFAIVNQPSWYGLHNSCFRQSFDVKAEEDFRDIAAQSQPEDQPQYRVINSSFFHGKFRKYSASMGGKHYILKVEEGDFPELPATEYLCNQIFKCLGVHLSPFYLILFEEKSCFVTQNFMASQKESSLVHIYHFFQEKMPYSCENLINIIGEKTGRLVALEDFVYLTLADSLIGNNDRHGRNLGLIQSHKGYALSPVYDNPSYLGVEMASLLGADHQPKGAIWTKASQEPSMTDYVFEWRRLGFDSVVNRFRKAVSLSKIQELIESSFITEKRQKALLRLINKRVDELWKT